ncbi:tRNA (adenosine(37)-N6)-dimethylallyltransferase MiaA [Methyloligella sp. GL2]|nr:tRNA (adenosine(37)-N6)-dimethylallyltransferase MiaA [Methyloligella sp. GL2]QKP78836.1 tRNA (adenosine(37)-N6)-dimethylallyltransferase MiaA [Methyloligella sp. GL2]
MPGAVLIAGPTASGKSAAALELAVHRNGTVINADSMQVYEELRVLTARPNLDEERLIPHRLYGIVSAAEPYSVGRWLADAARTISEVRAEGRLPILVGGTGLYFKALTEGLAAVPEIPKETREHWREKAEALPPQELHALLVTRDPQMAARLPATDPQRIVRALEVIEATGVSLAEWQKGQETPPVLRPSQALRLLIAPDREALYAKIERRFDTMLDMGAGEEVERLLALDLDPGLPAMRAHGVPEIAAWLRGEISREEAIARAKTVTRRYAKRQLTWARRFMADWNWFEDGPSAVAWVEAQHIG